MAPFLTQRLGGVSGIASAPATLIVSIGLLISGGDQRANLVPFVMPVAVLLMLGCVFGIFEAHRHHRNMILTSGLVMTVGALVGVSFFYIAVALSAVPAVAELIESDSAETIGTLLGSLLVIVILPSGLLLLGVGLLKACVLARWARPLPIVAVVLLALGAAAVSLVDDDKVVVAALLVLLGATWALLGTALLMRGAPHAID